MKNIFLLLVISVTAFIMGLRAAPHRTLYKTRFIKTRPEALMKPPSIITKIITRKVPVVTRLVDTIHDTVFVIKTTRHHVEGLYRKHDSLFYFRAPIYPFLPFTIRGGNVRQGIVAFYLYTGIDYPALTPFIALHLHYRRWLIEARASYRYNIAIQYLIY